MKTEQCKKFPVADYLHTFLSECQGNRVIDVDAMLEWLNRLAEKVQWLQTDIFRLNQELIATQKVLDERTKTP